MVNLPDTVFPKKEYGIKNLAGVFITWGTGFIRHRMTPLTAIYAHSVLHSEIRVEHFPKDVPLSEVPCQQSVYVVFKSVE
jgi:hypothetical protein